MRASWRPLWPQWRLALKSPWLSIAIFQDDKVHWDKHVHGTSKVKNPFRECPRTHRWQADLFGLPKQGWFIEEYKPDSWGQWSETWYRNDGCARLQEISEYYWNIHHYYMDYISEIQLVLAEMKHTRVIELWPLRPDITLLMSALVNIPASSWKGLWRYPEMSCEEEGGGHVGRRENGNLILTRICWTENREGSLMMRRAVERRERESMVLGSSSLVFIKTLTWCWWSFIYDAIAMRRCITKYHSIV